MDAGSRAEPAGPCAPARLAPTGAASLTPSGSVCRGAKGEPPPVFDVSGRGAFGAGAAGRVRDPGGQRALENPRGTQRGPPGAGPARPGTALVFLRRQRRKNNHRSVRVRNGNVFAACAFLGKIRKPFLPRNVGG